MTCTCGHSRVLISTSRHPYPLAEVLIPVPVEQRQKLLPLHSDKACYPTSASHWPLNKEDTEETCLEGKKWGGQNHFGEIFIKTTWHTMLACWILYPTPLTAWRDSFVLLCLCVHTNHHGSWLSCFEISYFYVLFCRAEQNIVCAFFPPKHSIGSGDLSPIHFIRSIGFLSHEKWKNNWQHQFSNRTQF